MRYIYIFDEACSYGNRLAPHVSEKLSHKCTWSNMAGKPRRFARLRAVLPIKIPLAVRMQGHHISARSRWIGLASRSELYSWKPMEILELCVMVDGH